jgi:hypothetical protein
MMRAVCIRKMLLWLAYRIRGVMLVVAMCGHSTQATMLARIEGEGDEGAMAVTSFASHRTL